MALTRILKEQSPSDIQYKPTGAGGFLMTSTDPVSFDPSTKVDSDRVKDITSTAATTDIPTSTSVWELVQDTIETLSGGLRTPITAATETGLLAINPETLEIGDFYIVEDMDAAGHHNHQGRMWINLQNPSAAHDPSTNPKIWYDVEDQYNAPDEVTLTTNGAGSMKIKDNFFNDNFNSRIILTDSNGDPLNESEAVAMSLLHPDALVFWTLEA